MKEISHRVGKKPTKAKKILPVKAPDNESSEAVAHRLFVRRSSVHMADFYAILLYDLVRPNMLIF